MTYIPPERDDEDDDVLLDRTQKLTASPAPALPAVGNGVDPGGQPAPFQPEQSPTVPFAADRGAALPAEPVFEDARPPRDRIAFQLIWESVLLILAAGALSIVYRDREAVFGTDAGLMDLLDTQLLALAPVLLVVVALGLSLRLGAVNLAVPVLPFVIASVTTLFIDEEPLIGLAWTAAAAAAVTVVFCVLNLALRVPPWMAGLVAAFALGAAVPPLGRLSEEGSNAIGTWDLGDGFRTGLWLFAAVALLAVAGGLIGLIPAVRDRFSDAKSAATGTGPREGRGVALIIAGTFGSSLLAALAGFLPMVLTGPEAELESLSLGMFGFAADGWMVVTPFVLIAVLLGGTVLWGRRGGIAGAVLATLLLWAGLQIWGNLEAPESDPGLYTRWTGALYAGLLILGLVVSFGLNHFGRPKDPEDAEDAPEGQPEPSPFTPAQPSLFDPNATNEPDGAPADPPRAF